MYLLDTMIVSEMRKSSPDKSVATWLGRVDAAQLFVSSLVFGELRAGAHAVRLSNPKFHAALVAWIDQTRAQYRSRTHSVTTQIVERWGELYARLGRRDLDLFIAATALTFDLTLVTRNTRHFEPTGAKLFNPYLDRR
jgi:predicted nucleic acid-binding protein